MIRLVLDGPPIPWKRPGGSTYRYDEQKTIKRGIIYEIKKQLLENRVRQPITHYPRGPLKMDIVFFTTIPASLAQKDRDELFLTYVYKKPDTSNMIKFYEDTANALLYRDDAQIAFTHAQKIYHYHPKTVITLTELSRGKIDLPDYLREL